MPKGMTVILGLGKPTLPPRSNFTPRSEQEQATPTPTGVAHDEAAEGEGPQLQGKFSSDQVGFHDSTESCATCVYLEGTDCQIADVMIDDPARSHCNLHTASGVAGNPREEAGETPAEEMPGGKY